MGREQHNPCVCKAKSRGDGVSLHSAPAPMSCKVVPAAATETPAVTWFLGELQVSASCLPCMWKCLARQQWNVKWCRASASGTYYVPFGGHVCIHFSNGVVSCKPICRCSGWTDGSSLLVPSCRDGLVAVTNTDSSRLVACCKDFTGSTTPLHALAVNKTGATGSAGAGGGSADGSTAAAAWLDRLLVFCAPWQASTAQVLCSYQCPQVRLPAGQHPTCRPRCWWCFYRVQRSLWAG